MKKTTYSAAAAASAAADWSDAPSQAEAALEGLNPLFASSQIETTPEDEGKDVEGRGKRC